MRISTAELDLCKAWAAEHHGDDDPLDVFHWKLLEVAKEKTDRSANFHARELAEISADLDNLSTKFYATEAGTVPDGDPEVDF